MQVWDESFYEEYLDEEEDEDDWVYEILTLKLYPLILNYLYKDSRLHC
jgi:hypothetical protein